ncbi:META domain-containing protein [Shewanella sp. NIFS-20-20]|uniref:META domain-containing protein n=1 Tax=Shewanella sp. NIFS-20-20 TaxID=2853806 RepID=UPI001C4928B8|nr:META domain-containing protein [Shewanella sp. NIFS-20-20]MBV7316982.1 META domain-containing protein [Shewanella sp. NIFS-20-20]
MFKPVFAAATLALALGGCQSTPQNDDFSLIGQWKIDTIMGQATVDYSPAELTFRDDGTLSGNNSCNQFFGKYQYANNQLSLTPAGTTMKACVDALMAQEQLVNQALPEVATTQYANGKLSLLDSEGQVLLILTKQ